MNSPPYSSSEASLPPNIAPNGITPTMRSLLASTWQVLDQPPPPSLREILAAYKQKGDGDREMLLAMLNAKSSEDQRLASLASLRRTVLDVCRTTETPSSPQYDAPAQASPHLAHEQYCYSPAAYTPSASHQQMAHSPQLASALAFDSPPPSTQKTTLPSMRLRPSSSGAGVSTAEPQSRRKRARLSQSPSSASQQPSPQSSEHTRPHTASPEAELPPSPYSSTRERSVGPDSDHPAQQRERGAMAIGSLLSGGANGVKPERDDSWTSHRERRVGRDESSRSVNAS
ncbi:hypothetical protein M0805_008318 [Coniferiporia weirii]|nr:hypothetical protein M0805_008318 [Coniferiporia weirii]